MLGTWNKLNFIWHEFFYFSIMHLKSMTYKHIWKSVAKSIINSHYCIKFVYQYGIIAKEWDWKYFGFIWRLGTLSYNLRLKRLSRQLGESNIYRIILFINYFSIYLHSYVLDFHFHVFRTWKSMVRNYNSLTFYSVTTQTRSLVHRGHPGQSEAGTGMVLYRNEISLEGLLPMMRTSSCKFRPAIWVPKWAGIEKSNRYHKVKGSIYSIFKVTLMDREITLLWNGLE